MPLRFTITGCGSIASRHAACLQKYGKLVGVCDTEREKAELLGNAYRAEVYGNHELMLSTAKPDVSVICSPNGLHAEHATISLKNGAHVLCEKPMVITSHQGNELIKIADQTNRKLFVVKQNRYNPPVMLVKALLSENKLGRIISFHINCVWNRPDSYYNSNWRGTLALDGGVLFTQFSHFIDILYWFLGDVREVSGWRTNFQHKKSVEFEDTGVANMVMQSGAIGSLHYSINSFNTNTEGSIMLVGEKGTVKIGGHYLNTLEHFSVEDTSLPELQKGNQANSYGYYTGSMSNHDKVYQELYRALQDSSYKFLEAAEANKSIALIEKIYAASPLLETI